MSARSLLVLTLTVALLGAVVQPALAQPKTAELIANGSEIVFTTRQMGVPVEGRFERFSAQVALDPKRPETGSVRLSIATGSTRFGSAEIDAEVPKPAWLNTAAFPQATFESNRIKATGPGRFEVSGRLAIKGASSELTVPVQVTQAGGISSASGSFVIQRLAFKVGDGEWADTSMVANEVQVRFKLQLAGVPPL